MIFSVSVIFQAVKKNDLGVLSLQRLLQPAQFGAFASAALPCEIEQMATQSATSQDVVHQGGDDVLFIGAMQSRNIKRVIGLQSFVCLDPCNPKGSKVFFVHTKIIR